MPAKGLKWDEVKYKDTMPAQLIEMFSRGKDRCHFCAHHSISENHESDTHQPTQSVLLYFRLVFHREFGLRVCQLRICTRACACMEGQII